jgi:2-polyprenyl-3-methyl-5-hydroxy-6-metoxy-1,4-benzoquinol methylase
MSTATEKGANIPPIQINPNKFKGHVVVVTGAAQGIAKTTATLFAQQGATVVLVDVQEALVKSTTAGIKEQGGHAVFRVTDIASEEACNQLVDSVIGEFGKIDVLDHGGQCLLVLLSCACGAATHAQSRLRKACPDVQFNDTARVRGPQRISC